MKIIIGQGSCGIAAGAGKTYDAFAELIKKDKLSIPLLKTGCIGTCYLEPIVDVVDDQGNKTTYVKVTAEIVAEIWENHIKNGKIVEKYIMSADDIAKLARQKRIALRNCGQLNPEDIEEYIAGGGYRAAQRCVTQLTPAEIIEIIKESGLRGRGGA
ncbi:MAG: NADH-quinone oxidoreductase subunit F, partial [Clostridiales bacterium]